MPDTGQGHYVEAPEEPIEQEVYTLATRNTKRKFPDDMKSLLHFNYPYYAEAHDGLGDEISSEIWTRAGNAKLVGEDFPADAIVANTPKFGYRCLQTAGSSDYISCTNTSGIWHMATQSGISMDGAGSH